MARRLFPMPTSVEIRDGDRAVAVVRPSLGGWLTRYARRTRRHGWVEAIHDDPAVVARYPDRMWAGNPILFPHVSYSVGQGVEGQHEIGGRLFKSPQHGFARRVPWAVAARTPSSVTMELTESEQTLASYPYRFRHAITYQLVDGRLEWHQVVENRDGRPMPFSTGFHPYLRVPLVPGNERNRCFIRLPSCTRFHAAPKAASFTKEAFGARDLGLDVDVSEAWFLGDFAKRQVALVDPTAGLEVLVNFEENPAYRFLALWSRTSEDPFYCVEPWTALPNSFGRADDDLGLLPPGGRFEARLWMDVRE